MYNGLEYNDFENSRKFPFGWNNNCYTYAINQPVNPFTKEKYEDYDYCQPGNLGNRSNNDILPIGDYSNMIKLVKEDLNLIGLDIKESTYEEYIPDPNCWKIALAICNHDYHWYRQNSDGTWSHKKGPETAQNYDSSDNIIYNPENCDRGKYKDFKGFYMITPLAIQNNIQQLQKAC